MSRFDATLRRADARRLCAWAAIGALVALVAFSPFRGDRNWASSDTSWASPAVPPSGAAPEVGEVDEALRPGSPSGVALAGDPAGGGAGDPPASSPPIVPPADTGAGPPAEPVPVPPGEPTDEQVAVFGPVLRVLDRGQASGSPLVLGIATSLVAAGLPSSDQAPGLEPVLAALGEVIALPNARINELTAANSAAIAKLEESLADLAVLNPALNAAIERMAEALLFGASAVEPASGPLARTTAELAELLGFLRSP